MALNTYRLWSDGELLVFQKHKKSTSAQRPASFRWLGLRPQTPLCDTTGFAQYVFFCTHLHFLEGFKLCPFS